MKPCKLPSNLMQEGISCEIIDVASIKPLDIETILASVEKTGRCVIVHEAAKTCGVGGEISAQIGEHCLTDLLRQYNVLQDMIQSCPIFNLKKNISQVSNALKMP